MRIGKGVGDPVVGVPVWDICLSRGRMRRQWHGCFM